MSGDSSAPETVPHSVSGCVFCEIVAGKREAAIVLENEQAVAFRDIDPQAPTHVLVVPRTHIADFAELRPEHALVLVAVASAAQQVAATEGIAGGGYRIVANVGRHAGNSVAHLHLHLLGGRRLGWPPG